MDDWPVAQLLTHERMEEFCSEALKNPTGLSFPHYVITPDGVWKFDGDTWVYTESPQILEDGIE